jgi:hypothetical protein
MDLITYISINVFKPDSIIAWHRSNTSSGTTYTKVHSNTEILPKFGHIILPSVSEEAYITIGFHDADITTAIPINITENHVHLWASRREDCPILTWIHEREARWGLRITIARID